MTIIEKIKAFFTGIAASYKGGTRDFQLVLNIVIIIMINLAATGLNVRFDLTRNGTYSLSDKSKDVVDGLRENLKVKVLFSTKDLPGEHKALYRYLIDILDEYEYYGNKYFSYTIVPEKDLEKEAADFGIRPVQSREFDDDQVKLRSTYMSLVIQQADLVEKVQAVTSPAGLEYQITSIIMKMSGKIDGLLSLNEPVQFNLYLDSNLKNLPIDGIATLEKTVGDAVARSNVNNYDKIKFNVIDTSREENKKDLAALYGLKKIKWAGGKTSSGLAMRAGEGYLGMVMQIPGKFSVIDINVMPSLFGNYVLSGLDGLDDRINNSIGSLVSSNPRVGYVTGHQEPGINDEQSREGAVLFNRIIADVYEVREINLSTDEIPGDIGTLVIAGPRSEFSDYELYKIDQFIMKGKSVLFFIDSFQEVNMGQQNFMGQQEPMVLPLNTNLDKLLNHYGVSVGKNIVLDKNSAKVNMGNMIREYPLIPIITDKGLNEENVITRYLKGAVFAKASTVDADSAKLKKNSIISVDLVSSSDESWLMTGRISYNPYMMEPGNEKDFKSYPLARLLTGSFQSYFSDKPVPVNEKDAKKPAAKSMVSEGKLDRTIGSAKSNIIVIGTSEIMRSGFLMDSRKVLASGMGGQDEDTFSNGLLLHNMVDFAAGNYHIPEIKSKSLDFNPIDKVDEGKKLFFKVLNMGGVPLLVIIAWIVMWRLREAKRRRIQESFAQEG